MHATYEKYYKFFAYIVGHLMSLHKIVGNFKCLLKFISESEKVGIVLM